MTLADCIVIRGQGNIPRICHSWCPGDDTQVQRGQPRPIQNCPSGWYKSMAKCEMAKKKGSEVSHPLRMWRWESIARAQFIWVRRQLVPVCFDTTSVADTSATKRQDNVLALSKHYIKKIRLHIDCKNAGTPIIDPTTHDHLWYVRPQMAQLF